MGREVWYTLRHSREFYIRLYRRGIQCLLISMSINLLLIIGIYYVYFQEKEPDFYATSGITPPIPLRALQGPNFSSSYWLEPDPTNENEEKLIPQ